MWGSERDTVVVQASLPLVITKISGRVTCRGGSAAFPAGNKRWKHSIRLKKEESAPEKPKIKLTY
jgi:hypothetical protein